MDPIHTFDDDEKIEWMQGRVEKMLLVPLRDPEIRTRFNHKTKPDYDLNLGMMTLVCCAIEALGGFYLGGSEKIKKCPKCGTTERKPGAARCFREFIKSYVPDYKPVAHLLYESFRSALAHSFAITDGTITDSLGKPFVKGNKNSPHKIDFDWFISAVDAGISRYFNDLAENPDLRVRFLKHWDKEYAFWTHISKCVAEGEV